MPQAPPWAHCACPAGLQHHVRFSHRWNSGRRLAILSFIPTHTRPSAATALPSTRSTRRGRRFLRMNQRISRLLLGSAPVLLIGLAAAGAVLRPDVLNPASPDAFSPQLIAPAFAA